MAILGNLYFLKLGYFTIYASQFIDYLAENGNPKFLFTQWIIWQIITMHHF